MTRVPLLRRMPAIRRMLFIIVAVKSLCLVHLVYSTPPAKRVSTATILASYYDGGHYAQIAREGYEFSTDAQFPVRAFFPLIPLLMRCLFAWGGDAATFVIFNSFISIVSGLLIGSHIRKYYGESIALATLALMFASPGALFFDMAYSESVYLLLLGVGLLTVDRKRPTGFVATGLAIGLCRPQGLAIAAMGGRDLAPNRITLGAMSSGLGFLGFAGYLAWHTGDSLEIFRVQQHWGRTFSFESFLGSGFALDWIFLALTLAALGFGARHLKERELLFLGLTAAIPLATGSLMSFTRFAGVIYPLFIFLASIAWRRAGFWGVATVFLALFTLRAIMHVHIHAGRFVG